MFDAFSDIMSADDVAVALGVSRNKAYKILKKGELKAYREGPVWKVAKLALIDYVMKKGNIAKEAYGEYAVRQ